MRCDVLICQKDLSGCNAPETPKPHCFNVVLCAALVQAKIFTILRAKEEVVQRCLARANGQYCSTSCTLINQPLHATPANDSAWLEPAKSSLKTCFPTSQLNFSAELKLDKFRRNVFSAQAFADTCTNAA